MRHHQSPRKNAPLFTLNPATPTSFHNTIPLMKPHATPNGTQPYPPVQGGAGGRHCPALRPFISFVRLIAPALACLAVGPAHAATVLGPWQPIFKGIEHAVGTNTPGGGGFPELQVAYFLRVDLTDPDIRLFASPRRTNWVANGAETYGLTLTNFVRTYGLQVAVNANQFSPSSYFQAEGIACNVNGMVFSQGKMVSPPVTSGTADAATLCFTSNNVPTYYPTNIPAASTSGVYTAVSGYYNILYNGVNVGSNYIGVAGVAHQLQPRTALGLSQDRRYLFLLVIDGRQSSLDYSAGAYDWETAEWLKLAGAWDGANLDGGGSSCMVMQGDAGIPVPLNHDSASLTSPGYRERTVGAHFGVYAAPLPGFFNDIIALPDDTAATLTWTTIEPTTTQVQYGPATDLGMTTPISAELTTNHAVLLTNLTAGTEYYFTLSGTGGTTEHVSAMSSFTTTNYLTASILFELTNAWGYTAANLDGVAWTTRNYDDAAWVRDRPGSLWCDTRGLNDEIPIALNTEMPSNDQTGYPYRTYYLRTHFSFTGEVVGTAFTFQHYIDDGAVFYLNGTEIQRVRMDEWPALISNNTLAIAYPCEGNATCPGEFSVFGSLLATNLIAGDNVLAVEVHNYSAGSPDITFGLSATYTQPYVLSPGLNLTHSNGVVTLSWNRGGFRLQQSDSPVGPWTDVPGPSFVSPFTTNPASGTAFFRLKK
jgi:hypothetical protein